MVRIRKRNKVLFWGGAFENKHDNIVEFLIKEGANVYLCSSQKHDPIGVDYQHMHETFI